LDGGYPFEPILREMRAMGVTPILPPSPGASRLEALRELWVDAGLVAVETKPMPVQRVFDDFDDFWDASTGTGGMQAALAGMAADDIGRLKTRVRARLPADERGRITFGARANAIKGRVPR